MASPEEPTNYNIRSIFSANNAHIAAGQGDLTVGSHNIQVGNLTASHGSNIHVYNRSMDIQAPLTAAQKLMHWIFPYLEQCKSVHDIARSSRVPGTGSAFFESETYLDWLEGDQDICRSLECCAPLGSGKTSIASEVIERLQEMFQLEINGRLIPVDETPPVHPGERVVLYAYFTDNAQSCQTIPIVFAYLLLQLAWRRSEPAKVLQGLYDKHHFAHNTPELPRLDKIMAILKSEILLYDKVYIVVDGLDVFSADYSASQSLISRLEQLNAKLLVTSRHSVGFTPGTFFHISVKAYGDDVRRILDRSCQDNRRLANNVARSPGLSDEIVHQVVEKSDGIFLIAKFYIDGIACLLTPDDIRSALDELPAGVDHTYHYTMKRIRDQGPDLAALALAVLAWVTHAEHELTVMELRCAITFLLSGFKRRRLTEDSLLGGDDILSACAGLVIFVGIWKVQFVHSSMKHFFQRNSNNYLPNVARKMAETCLHYLITAASLTSVNNAENIILFEGMGCKAGDRLIEDFPFCEHAATWWGRYAYNAQEFSDHALVNEFFQFPVSPYIARSRDIGIHPRKETTSKCYQELYLARFGLYTLLRGVYLQDPTLVATAGPLTMHVSSHPVSFSSSDELVLPQAGSSFPSLDVDYTLLCAAAGGNAQMVAYLLDKEGANPNPDLHIQLGGLAIAGRANRNWNHTIHLKYFAGPSPLSVAAAGGHVEIVAMLLDRGADPDPGLHTQPGGIQLAEHATIDNHTIRLEYHVRPSPLSGAAAGGHAKIVAMLLDRGANPNASLLTQPGGIHMAEHAAIDTHTIRLEYHASLSPLSGAAAGGHTEIVAMLLDRGANPNPSPHTRPGGIQMAEYATIDSHNIHLEFYASPSPLSSAAAGGHAEIVAMLLDREANPNTNLHTQPGGLDMAEHTTIKGHTIHLEYYASPSPISGAAAAGHAEIVAMLLDRGANPNPSLHTQPGGLDMAEYATIDCHTIRLEYHASPSPLSSAAAAGHTEIAAMLLDRGANPNTHLHTQPESGGLEIAQAAHAAIECHHIHVEYHSSPSPLSDAAASGHEEIVAMLLKRGADPNLSLRICGSLEMAEHLNMVSYISLEYHAPQSPLSHAAASGHLEIVRLLAQNKANLDGSRFGCVSATLNRIDLREDPDPPLRRPTVRIRVSSAGKTPLEFAVASGDPHIARMLDIDGLTHEDQTFLEVLSVALSQRACQLAV